MGIDRLRVIDTGLDPVTAEREQWDDGNNTLALAPRLAVAYERNTVTNAALEAAGIEVVRIAGSELGQRPGRAALHVLPGGPHPALIPGALLRVAARASVTERFRPPLRRIPVNRGTAHPDLLL